MRCSVIVQRETYEGKGVDPGASDPRTPMQMRSRRTSGRSDLTNHLTGFHFLPISDENVREVKIERIQPKAVVQIDALSGKM